MKNVLWTDETEAELLGLIDKCYVCRQPNTKFQIKNLIL